jgi:hypothetical protein
MRTEKAMVFTFTYIFFIFGEYNAGRIKHLGEPDVADGP